MCPSRKVVQPQKENSDKFTATSNVSAWTKIQASYS